MSPNTGPVAGGTSVTITGSGFTGATAVDFGANNATTYTVNSDTQITATSPAGTGVVDVTVTTPVGGTSATSSADQFTYGPTITGLSPTSGPFAGGTSVTITGIGFTGATAVNFGASTATSFTVLSGTQITAISPAGAGVVDVTVTTPLGGTSATSGADQFTFVAVPTVTGLNPTAGPVGGGTSVTITGTGFTGATAVKFGANNATSFTVVSSTQITAVDPAGSGAVDVTVTTSGGTSATSSADRFTYVVAPTVTGLSPTFGPVSGGTSVVITGTGFAGATAVSFGGTAATSFTVNSATQITAVAPAHALGTIDVTVTTLGGTSATSTSDHFAYVGTGSIVVTTASDAVSHTGTSLRDAIASANSDAAAGQFDTITFASSLNGQTITLIQGALTLSGAGAGTISINGSGNISISGNNQFQMLTVASGVSAVVTGLNLVNSYTTSSDVGGAVHNSGTLTVDNCSFTGNNATGSSSALSNAGVATINDCFISGNSHGAVGNFATMILVDSTLSGNYSATTIAGSLYTTSSSYTTLIGDTISNNYANGGGGLTNSGTMTILDSTVADNSAVAGNNGGGIIAYGGTLNIINTTVTGNMCGGNGGGIYVSGGSVTLLNSIVSGNSTSGSAPDFSQGGGTLTINHTLIGNTAGSGITSSSGTGNILNPSNSGLGTFGDYGGPTQTVPLLSGSPAIGVAASPSTASAVAMTASTVTVASGLLFGASSLPTLPQFSFTTQPTTASEGNTLSPAITLQDLGAGAYFYIQIGGEEMAVTGLTLSGNTATLTVVRGANNTTASSHAANASVYLVSDQRGQVASFNNPAVVDLGAYQSTASSPAALNSNPIAGATVTLTISAGVLNGTLTATTDATGTATFSDLSVPYAGTYTLEATTSGVPGASSIPFTITEPASAPTVTTVSPNSGSTSGGTTVVITGTNFTGATAVLFGTTAAMSFAVNSSTQITAVTPAEAAGNVYVLVSNPSGNSEIAANAQFTYVMPPASVVVTTASDAVSHTGVSLRDAIGTANADAAAGESAIITFASSLNGQTITLTQGTLTLTGSGAGTITISGNNHISVSGNNQYRDFSVASAVNAVFSGLTIENGWLSSAYGSGINSAGNVSLLNCTVSYNSGSTSAYWADGVFSTGTMTITNCTVSHNGVGVGTGGVYNYGGTMTVSNTTISSNLSAGLSNTGTIWVYNSNLTGNFSSTTGAGGFGNTGTATLVNVAISDNTANSNSGILNVNNGVVTVVDCAISGNYAYAGGGGVHNANGCMMTIIDSTIAGNMAPGNQGGGIINDGTMTVTGTTVVGNSAPTAAGILNDGSVALFDTIVAANVGGGSDISGAISGSNNLIGNGTGMSGVSNGTNGNLVGTAINPINPLLNPLGNNGGPTQTMSEQTGSPAIGTGGAVTTLGAALSDTTSTSVTIPRYATFAAQALTTLSSSWYFIIQIDGEQMAVTGLTPTSGTTGTLTVIRGINGTAAATHPSGASVNLVSDQRGFVVPSNNPPVVDIGAYQSTGSALLPTVVSINPSSGSTTGGTSVVISGTNFTDATAVMFGANNATTFTVNSDSQITATDPAGAGSVDVTVVTPIGTSATSSADQFTYSDSTTTSIVSNPVGPITQGTPITFTANISGGPNVGTVSFYYDYGADDQFQIGGAVNVSAGSATSNATTALPSGADAITAIYSGGVGFDGSQGTLTIQVIAPPPTVVNVVINQDIPALYDAAGQPTPGAQRSMVDDIVYTFSEPVDILNSSIDPNVFTVAVAPGWTGTVPTIIEWSPVAGSVNSQWKVDFSGASIANGAYTITITDPTAITAESDGQALNLAPSGIGAATQSFYRLFGDINGEEVVNAADNIRFKQALATYNVAFDINQDGYVNAYDSSYFKQDLNLSFAGFTPTI